MMIDRMLKTFFGISKKLNFSRITKPDAINLKKYRNAFSIFTNTIDIPPYLSSHLHKSKFSKSMSRIHKQSFGTVLSRNTNFSTVNEDDIKAFESILGKSAVITDEDSLKLANVDWMGKYTGKSKLLLRPKSTTEVSRVLAYSHGRNLAIVPQGGNTGLVGGSVPVFDEIILNMGRMNSIISFDEVSGVLTCESGCILENLDNFVKSHGFMMPLDLGAKGSCQVGGNLSTNAGGIRFMKYGSLHANVLGLEAVLANGEVLDLMSTLRKNNTGYDLKHVFIGSEGTLGIITKISILTFPKPDFTKVSFLACPNYDAVKNTFKLAKKSLSDSLSAFEFMDSQSLALVYKHFQDIKNPLPHISSPFYILIETSGNNEQHEKEKFESFFEECFSSENVFVMDGVLAQDEAQASSIWKIREAIGDALKKEGAVYKYDFSLPLSHFYELVVEMRRRLEGKANVVAWGHFGDGNLHLNISTPFYSNEVLDLIEPYVYEFVSLKNGSISAEHGIGRMKPHVLRCSRSENAIKLMAALKQMMDPKQILNPYKVLPKL